MKDSVPGVPKGSGCSSAPTADSGRDLALLCEASSVHRTNCGELKWAGTGEGRDFGKTLSDSSASGRPAGGRTKPVPGGAAFAYSLIISVAAELTAMALTVIYVNTKNFAETNPTSQALLNEYGSGIILINVARLLVFYAAAGGLTLLLKNKLSRKRFRNLGVELDVWVIYFFLVVTPISATFDALGDIVVVGLRVNPYAFPGEGFVLAVLLATPISLWITRRRYTEDEL